MPKTELVIDDQEEASLPLDIVEGMAAGNNWPFERTEENEIMISVAGELANYEVAFTWMGDLEALHLACEFELKVPEPRRSEVGRLVLLINEQLWIGHFDVWKEGMILFLHALVLAGNVQATASQCECMFGTALDTCERYYTAFQFVIWAGKSAREAMDAAMFDTEGSA
jgi:hypothetical protein